LPEDDEGAWSASRARLPVDKFRTRLNDSNHLSFFSSTTRPA
jgi:hypothetical protein